MEILCAQAVRQQTMPPHDRVSGFHDVSNVQHTDISPNDRHEQMTGILLDLAKLDGYTES